MTAIDANEKGAHGLKKKFSNELQIKATHIHIFKFTFYVVYRGWKLNDWTSIILYSLCVLFELFIILSKFL